MSLSSVSSVDSSMPLLTTEPTIFLSESSVSGVTWVAVVTTSGMDSPFASSGSSSSEDVSETAGVDSFFTSSCACTGAGAGETVFSASLLPSTSAMMLWMSFLFFLFATMLRIIAVRERIAHTASTMVMAVTRMSDVSIVNPME